MMTAADFDPGNDFACTRADDEHWQAMRYVLGEMSSEESDAFERTLACDQTARELVAVSTELVLTVSRSAEFVSETASRLSQSADPRLSTRPVAIAPRRRGGQPLGRRQQTIAYLTALGAVVTAAVLLFASRGSRQVEDKQAGDPIDSRTSRLVAIWSDLLSETGLEAGTSVFADGLSDHSEMAFASNAQYENAQDGDGQDGPSAISADSATVAAAGSSANDEFHVPGWLLAAVSIDETSPLLPTTRSNIPSSPIREN